MPRKDHVPGYLRHKASNRGYSLFGGRAASPTYFPGPYGSDESRAAYARALAEWEATGRITAGRRVGAGTVAELVDGLWQQIDRQGHYLKNGRPTSERHCLRAAFAPLLALYAGELTADVGLTQLDALAAEYERLGMARSTVKKHLQRVRSLFAWGKDRGLVPESVRLVSGRGLARRQKGRGRATDPKRPPDLFSVGAVQLVAPGPIGAMLWLQLLNGIRPGGIVAMRPRDVDRAGPLWLYTEPPDAAAKTGCERHWLGPRAQAILGPWLDAAPALDAPVFRPPRRRSRAGYTVNLYRLTIVRLCDRLGLPRFHPHQLRHAHATAVRQLYGLEGAQARLGHRRASTTEIYAATSTQLAQKIAAEIG